MRYVNDWRGLDPSEYAGGGSASSSLLLRDGWPAWFLVSCGRARLVSSWNRKAADALFEDPGATWSDCPYAGAALDDEATS